MHFRNHYDTKFLKTKLVCFEKNLQKEENVIYTVYHVDINFMQLNSIRMKSSATLKIKT
jgi:hypothetical protein